MVCVCFFYYYLVCTSVLFFVVDFCFICVSLSFYICALHACARGVCGQAVRSLLHAYVHSPPFFVFVFFAGTFFCRCQHARRATPQAARGK
ncbi:hypothetical protein TRSC58_07623 [Trypanosoma rangeli SC58]|uniref:Uncharacterized protein n=1 Tax=Trypanosoma rangeli SC58 TaxID=429131 RepID=A0A061IRS2_TRYRA|nr:hypothetical protein TRSC58_07623 [Trypanosoma rangeli SC58]